MIDALANANLLGGPLVIIVYVVAAVLFVWMSILSFRRDISLSARWTGFVLSAVVGVLSGLALSWLINDVWTDLGQPLFTPTTAWGCAALAATAVSLNSLRKARWRSRLLSIIVIPVVLLAGAVGINTEVGLFRTPSDVFGGGQLQQLALQDPSGGAGSAAPAEPLWKTWVAPADLPASGQLGTAVIPATASNFSARPAVVYLPPAALVQNPPKLPVVIAFSGQPGEPNDVFQAGGLQQWLDAYAASHNGLAPIVVSPDQLGAPEQNPMCIDSPLGNSATYLSVDVPNWIRANLNVLPDRDSWGIAGFSQGGTCAIQLGAAHPEMFGSIVDISGEEQPRNGTAENTISVGFGGSADAYSKAWPLTILTSNAPYSDTVAVFVVGSDDAEYLPGQVAVSDAAKAAGMDVTYLESPGTGHDWLTATYGFSQGMQILCTRFGLNQ